MRGLIIKKGLPQGCHGISVQDQDPGMRTSVSCQTNPQIGYMSRSTLPGSMRKRPEPRHGICIRCSTTSIIERASIGIVNPLHGLTASRTKKRIVLQTQVIPAWVNWSHPVMKVLLYLSLGALQVLSVLSQRNLIQTLACQGAHRLGLHQGECAVDLTHPAERS